MKVFSRCYRWAGTFPGKPYHINIDANIPPK